MTVSIMSLSIRALSIRTLSILTQSIIDLIKTLSVNVGQLNDTQH